MLQIEEILQTHPSSARLPHDDKYEHGAAFIHGEYCAAAEAVIPLSDLGFSQSDAVYDKATLSRGRYFRLQDHFDRFARSAEKFRLHIPHSEKEMVDIFDNLIRLTGLKDAGVWWCVTRGLIKANVAPDRANPNIFENRFYVKVDPYVSITTREQRQRGLDLLVSERYIRIPSKAVDPTAKNFHWQDMKLSLFDARDHGKDWSVLTDVDGYLTEPPGANIFVIKGGQLYTPDSRCLEGITRKSALELAEMIGIPSHARKVHVRELREADEAFITSSAGGIMPINSVDGVVLGGIAGPGELSMRLHDLYWEKMWEGWKCTPANYEDSAV